VALEVPPYPFFIDEARIDNNKVISHFFFSLLHWKLQVDSFCYRYFNFRHYFLIYNFYFWSLYKKFIYFKLIIQF
jgi:hypothetical protein